jgi:Mg-chelatase subunit ChlD
MKTIPVPLLHPLVLICLLFPSFAPGAEASAITSSTAHPRMEIVFVLDTTGSMGSMIEGAKKKIWAIASKLKSARPTPEIRFGLVAYRDRGDTYVTKIFPLSTSLDDVYGHLTDFKAEGGGDEPESVNEALARAISDFAWSTDSQVLRAIFLVGDAPPHMDYPDDVKWDQSCRVAKQRGILINTLQCGSSGETERVWRAIARLAGGAYSSILKGGATTAIDTRFDGDIVGIARAMNETVILYGAADEQAGADRNRSLLEAMSIEGIADRSSFLSKGDFGAVITGKGDLVVEILAGRLTLATVDPQRLDPRLAALPPAERDAQIMQMVERRRELQTGLQKLLDQREAAVAERMKSAAGSDDIVELSPFVVIEDEAESRGYSFKKN